MTAANITKPAAARRRWIELCTLARAQRCEDKIEQFRPDAKSNWKAFERASEALSAVLDKEINQ